MGEKAVCGQHFSGWQLCHLVQFLFPSFKCTGAVLWLGSTSNQSLFSQIGAGGYFLLGHLTGTEEAGVKLLGLLQIFLSDCGQLNISLYLSSKSVTWKKNIFCFSSSVRIFRERNTFSLTLLIKLDLLSVRT